MPEILLRLSQILKNNFIFLIFKNNKIKIKNPTKTCDHRQEQNRQSHYFFLLPFFLYFFTIIFEGIGVYNHKQCQGCKTNIQK